MTVEHKPALQEKQTGRVEAFSDGVIAIIITLLVFNVRTPSAEQVETHGLLQALLNQWRMYLAFGASFFFVLVMWVNHHRLFIAIRRLDSTSLFLNGLLLFGISLLPFPTAVMAEYIASPSETTAMIFYNGWFMVIAFFFNLLWRYASDENRLFDAGTDPHLVHAITRQYTFGPLLYLATVLLTFLSPILAFLVNIGLAVFFAIPSHEVAQFMNFQSTE